jgi:hypothetical protein
MIVNNGDDHHEEFAPKIDKLCCLAAQWIEQASVQNPGRPGIGRPRWR